MESLTEIRIIQGRDLKKTVEEAQFAALPLGSIEYHGPHAPYGTDLILAEGFSRLLKGNYKGVLYPAIPYSACPGKTQHYPGTISISPSIMTQYVCEVLEGICRTGFTKILILNAHDANMGIARTAAEWVTGKFAPCSILILNWWQMVALETVAGWGVFSGSGRGHGGPYEISAVQALCPEAVQVMPDDPNFETPPPLSNYPYVLVERSPKGWDGYTGRISETSLETGKKIVKEAATNLSKVVQDWLANSNS
ncbi:creatininase family protein [Effusibacillus lacus]|uniref:Creatininase n=1 Tax=Effusibacillus lacus TaxID=1348429 RepID=A0A292YQF3_9BACL|nr:creatininase family protein [Effusibacillus lacus]TCS71092.1 creatinine amidohydrolase [Effusibacillus lacus]GAX90735.1 creatininase [Effusibacillus lacus]